MVSLINFKLVNEDLLHQQPRTLQEADRKGPVGEMFVEVVGRQDQDGGHAACWRLAPSAGALSDRPATGETPARTGRPFGSQQKSSSVIFGPASLQHPVPAGQPSAGPVSGQSAGFAVSWRNLKFSIEPKWHHKIATGLAGRPGPSLAADGQSQEATTGAPVTRVVLDRLDGSFRSGELTAILGPSGE